MKPPEGQYGVEKGWPLGGQRKERREKTAHRIESSQNHDDKEEREEIREKSAERITHSLTREAAGIEEKNESWDRGLAGSRRQRGARREKRE